MEGTVEVATSPKRGAGDKRTLTNNMFAYFPAGLPHLCVRTLCVTRSRTLSARKVSHHNLSPLTQSDRSPLRMTSAGGAKALLYEQVYQNPEGAPFLSRTVGRWPSSGHCLSLRRCCGTDHHRSARNRARGWTGAPL